MVFALGLALIVDAPPSPALGGTVAVEMEFFRTLPVVDATELVLSLRPPALGRLLGVVVMCSFC